MRSAVFDAANSTNPDEQLTTGEAAKLLNSSRQHVVDLCEKGLLPHTTVGRHRRVRRGDVDALRGRSERLTADQQRSLWLAYAISGMVVCEPERARSLGQANLTRMREIVRGSAAQWIDEWERLLLGPLDIALEAYTSRDLRGRELRQHNPFAGLLDDETRRSVLAAWRRLKASNSAVSDAVA